MAENNAGATHIAAFFINYPDFEHNPTAPVSGQFRRLRQHYGWQDGSLEYSEAREAFAAALGRQFADFYGSEIDDINAWQALCVALKVDPVPDSVDQCKKIVKSTHVNLVDFIDTRITGQPVKIFETQPKLRRYTRRTGKIFPKESAKQSGVLKYLLREIFSRRRRS